MIENHYRQPNQPDVLEVIANLSSNEVFTPPRVANNVLDLLPESVWKDPNLRWLDPGAKTGVFPREITKRLMVGLADEIPDESARLQHILGDMVFAFAITDMTAMMTRRSLYCSKDASSEIAASPLPTPEGNVWHQRIEHSYDAKGRCAECGGTKAQLELAGRDNFAYGFIHAEGRKQIIKETNMKFDVIVGNPPYQMTGGGGGINDTAIYQYFVEMAIELNPRYVSFIIPSRWMSSGRGLEKFRNNMLNDTRIRTIVDYPVTEELFPGIQNEGGVCYFLWDSDWRGPCSFTLVRDGVRQGPSSRILSNFDVLVRDSQALPILEKVRGKTSTFVNSIASADTPFGLASNYQAWKSSGTQSYTLRLYHLVGGKRTWSYVSRKAVAKNEKIINKWKVYVPLARGGKTIPDQVIGDPEIGGPNTVCSQTFRYIGPFESKAEASSFESYLRTRFFRFLASLRKNSQNTYPDTYAWIPIQTWDRTWTDAELYKKYGITKDEQDYIATMVKEMPA
jgi:site-specific DNA-methyltransferase (adenine-specific)